MKKRSGDPWMRADDYGRGLTGFTANLLVTDVEASLVFQREVLAATVVYSDSDFAALEGCGARWMLHADHTYNDHPMRGVVARLEARGAGVELRLLGRDPDDAERAARKHDFIVLQGAMDKPHGLRECFLIDPDGYVWVPSVALGESREEN